MDWQYLRHIGACDVERQPGLADRHVVVDPLDILVVRVVGAAYLYDLLQYRDRLGLLVPVPAVQVLAQREPGPGPPWIVDHARSHRPRRTFSSPSAPSPRHPDAGGLFLIARIARQNPAPLAGWRVGQQRRRRHATDRDPTIRPGVHRCSPRTSSPVMQGMCVRRCPRTESPVTYMPVISGDLLLDAAAS